MSDASNSLCAIYTLTPEMVGKRPDYFFRFTQLATGNVLCNEDQYNEDQKFFMEALGDEINQQWILETEDGTYYRFLNVISRAALSAGSNGFSLSQDPINNSQLWRFEPTDDGKRFFIVSKVPSPNGGVEWVIDGNGTALYLHNKNGGPYQQWSPAAVPINYSQILINEYYYVQHGGTLSVTENSDPNDDTQLWRLDLLGDGYLRIVNKASGGVIDGNGSIVYADNWNGGNYQRWRMGYQYNSSGMEMGLQQKATQYFLVINDGQLGMSNLLPSQAMAGFNPSQRGLYLPKSMPYAQAVTAMAHDSHTGNYYPGQHQVPTNVDQTQPIDAQLAGGIRTVRISSGSYTDATTTVILQHGNPFAWGDMCVFGILQDYLTKVKQFLDANPNEVITIIDEGDSSGYLFDYIRRNYPPPPGAPEWHHDPTDADRSTALSEFTKLVAQAYESVFGNELFGRNGFINNMDPTNLQNPNWPTLTDMISNGQRVIVFMPNLSGGTTWPWILPAYYPTGLIMSNDYNADEPPHDGSESTNLRPTEDYTFFFSDRSSNQPPFPATGLYLVNNQYTQTLSSTFDWTESSQAYSIWTVGDLLVENTIRAWQNTGKKPNFINVDFYQGEWGAISTVIDLVNTLNQCDSYDQVLERWAGSPIVIQDYRTRDNTGIPKLQMGRNYVIQSTQAAGVNLGLEPDNDVEVHLVPADPGNKRQQWRLIYNSSSAGIALINQENGGYMYPINENDPNDLGDAVIWVGDLQGNGLPSSGWQIAYDMDTQNWWIRYSLNDDFHVTGGGDGNSGDAIQLRNWNGGENQHFIFTPVTD